MKKVSDYYTGGELIDRLGILAIDLVGAIIRQVVPYPTSELDGTFRTPESDPALYDPTICESPQAWVEQIRAAKFFKPFVQLSMSQIMAELGVCWESDAPVQGQAQEDTAPEAFMPCPTGRGLTPKEDAEQMLAEGRDPGEVMLALVSRHKKMPQWKAAALALRLPVVDLDEFERDSLKSKFQRRTKAYR